MLAHANIATATGDKKNYRHRTKNFKSSNTALDVNPHGVTKGMDIDHGKARAVQGCETPPTHPRCLPSDGQLTPCPTTSLTGSRTT